jgi:hypothetical protein
MLIYRHGTSGKGFTANTVSNSASRDRNSFGSTQNPPLTSRLPVMAE